MKEKKKKIKVKNKKVDQTIEQYQDFLWTLYDRQPKGKNKTILYFKRGETELVDRKGKKKVKKFEKAYRQISKKRVPVAVIVLTLITLAFFVPTFVIPGLEQLFKVILYTIGTIFAVCDLFALIIYIITMCKKKSLKATCVEKAQYYNTKIEGEEDPGQHINEVEELNE